MPDPILKLHNRALSATARGFNRTGINTQWRPMRMPRGLRDLRPARPSVSTRSATGTRGMEPRFSANWNTRPLAGPLRAGLARAAVRPEKTLPTAPSSQPWVRRRNCSRAADSSRSPAKGSTAGFNNDAPALRPATGWPRHKTRGARVSSLNRNSPSPSDTSRPSRAAASLLSARTAALATFFAAVLSSSRTASSGRNRKPSRRPMKCPSTVTSPFLLTAASRSSRSLMRLTRIAVRLSTKRCVSPRCSASDSLSSIARVVSCQWAASLSQAD